jgi:hypothetical protein
MNTETRLSRREVAGKYMYAVKVAMKHAQMWNCDTNGGNNLCHKSSQQTKSSTTPVYTDEWRISETNFVPTARTHLLMFDYPPGLVLASTVTTVGVNSLRFIHEKRAVCEKGCTVALYLW